MALTSQSTDALEPHEPFEFCLPRRIYDILKAFPEGSSVSIAVEDEKATVRCGRSRFTLQTLPAEDFPNPNEDERVEVIPLAGSVLRDLIQRGSYASASKDVRYYLNGTHFAFTPGQLSIASSDGHRLAKIEHPIACDLEHEMIVPSSAIDEMKRMLKEEEVSLVVYHRQIGLLSGQTMLISRLIDGKFPDVNRVIPRNSTTTTRINREAFTQALKRAKLGIGDSNLGLRVNVQQEELRISVGAEETMEDFVPCETSGADVEIGLNVDYLLDVMNALTDEFVRINLSDGNSSILIAGDTVDEGVNVIMPMRL